MSAGGITPHHSNPHNATKEITMSNINEMQSTLGKAIAIWRSGRNITFSMGTELREQGYDVAALAKAHRSLIEDGLGL